jgi:hypothetical protein
MVDTIHELSELSHTLNQRSDTLNEVITSLNQKLAKLNLGIEAWLIDPIEADDPYFHEEDEQAKFPKRDATLLGYCKFDDSWVLAAKRVTLVTKFNSYSGEDDEQIESVHHVAPLLDSSRNIRARAMRLIPDLLDLIKMKARALLKAIEEAEKTAQTL